MKNLLFIILTSISIISCQNESSSTDKQQNQQLKNEITKVKNEVKNLAQRIKELEKQRSATITTPSAPISATYNFEGAKFKGSAGIFDGKLRFYSQSGNKVELSGVLAITDVQGVAKIEGNKLICTSGCRGTLTILENGKNLVGKMDGNSVDLRRY